MCCRPTADICNNRRWCTYFKPVPFFAQRTQNFGLFWPIHKNQVCVNPALWFYNATPPFQLLLLPHLLPGDEDAEQPVHPALSVHKILVDQDSYFGLRELNMDSHFGWLAKYMCFPTGSGELDTDFNFLLILCMSFSTMSYHNFGLKRSCRFPKFFQLMK